MLIVECRLTSRPRRAAKDTKYILHQQLIVRGGRLVASLQQTLPASIEFRLFFECISSLHLAGQNCSQAPSWPTSDLEPLPEI
jgi:hypothetical protein